MIRNYISTLIVALVVASLINQNVSANEILMDSKLTLAAGVAQAKQNDMPLIVFGTNVGCHNCAGVKKSIDNTPELQMLMKQYVAVEVSAGGPEARALEKSTKAGGNNGPIPTPLVFIFTAKGASVYASPNVPLAQLKKSVDAYKELLISGITKNGGLHDPSKTAPGPNFGSDLAKAQKLMKDNQAQAAAALISKYATSEKKENSEELAQLMKITNLTVAKSKTEEQFDTLVNDVSEKGLSQLEAASTEGKSGDPTKAAVQLAALERAFGNFPKFAGKFDTAWKELLDKANIPNLKEQAKLIDDARQIDTGSSPTKAIAAYELVSKNYPGTKAAELSELRVKQLRGSKSTSAKPAAGT